jgi:hypothetical protein
MFLVVNQRPQAVVREVMRSTGYRHTSSKSRPQTMREVIRSE